jgi:hypothetical protein
MQTCDYFWGMYYSEALEKEVSIYFTETDHDPSVGVYHEFEWEALDENNKDVQEEMSDDEIREVEKIIYNELRYPPEPDYY